MSKSKGNVIDPLEMIERYSADSLRFTLALLAVQGRDIKLSVEKLEQSRNFTNKLFNASNFLLLNRESFQDLDDIEVKSPLGKYMLSRFNVALKETVDAIETYRFNDASTTIYRFLWGEFCDWGIELSKADKSSIDELGSIFKESMKLLHPFMPFISENLYQKLSNSSLEEAQSLMVKRYPKLKEIDSKIEDEFNLIMEAIVSIRRCKVLVDKANQRVDKVYIKLSKDLDKSLAKPFIEKLAKVDEVIFIDKS